MRGMYEEPRDLKREKEGLIKRSEEIVDEATRVKRENEKTAAKRGKFEETLSKLEDEYARVCVPLNSETKLSKSDIEKDLRNAQRKYLEQMILPRIVETEDFGPLFHRDSVDFALLIKQGLTDSRELQRSLEARIIKIMKKFGDEKRYIVNTPVDEVVEGFPEIELKWMFGDKEVVVPESYWAPFVSWAEEVA
ncbi:hypothetical protein NL676_020481 [Syzygium grande]|nr:hypothetical protein NL676_020481 [Syzygium grande]